MPHRLPSAAQRPVEAELAPLQIHALSHDGRGIGRLEDGKAVFVSGALPGETVRWQRTRRSRKLDEGRVLDVLEPSPQRVVPRCAHFGRCGGCVLQHLAPEAQLEAKQQALVEALERIGRVRPERVLEPLGGPLWGYRRKARLSVRYVEKKGRVLVGFRESGGRLVAELSRCEILAPSVGRKLEALATLIGSLDAAREIPQIEVSSGDEVVALVLRHLRPLSVSDRQRLRAFGAEHGLVILLQPGGIDSVEPLDPPAPRLAYALDGGALRLEFAPLDFIQVNAALNQAMVAQAMGLLAPRPDERILDLFCGLGNFTLPLARRAAWVGGVEGDAGLIARARHNAASNGLHNLDFHVADLREPQPREPWAREAWDALLLDPPRSGADALLDWFPLRRIGRILYVSCHPGSLARDAGILVQQQGFRLVAVGVMDMFPHTAHVESMALFERG